MKTIFTLLTLAALALAQGDVVPRWYPKSTPPATTWVTTEVRLRREALFRQFLTPPSGYNYLHHNLPSDDNHNNLRF
jgi:hypothetical protein